MVDKVGRILAILALIAITSAVLGRGWQLSKEGQPSDQELRIAMADALTALGVQNAEPETILHKFLYVEIVRDVPSGMTKEAVARASVILGHHGWVARKASDDTRVTLCKGKLHATVDRAQEGADSAGHVYVSWGDRSCGS